MTVMNYKGYTAHIEYSEEDGCLVGRVVGISDIISFHGDSIEETQKAFEESIDFHIETCARD